MQPRSAPVLCCQAPTAPLPTHRHIIPIGGDAFLGVLARPDRLDAPSQLRLITILGSSVRRACDEGE